MGIFQNGSVTPAAPLSADPSRLTAALAHYTSTRREHLGLTVAQAAELSGLELSQWCALEDGWVPESLSTVRAIAATLRVRWTEYHVATFLAGCEQKCR